MPTPDLSPAVRQALERLDVEAGMRPDAGKSRQLLTIIDALLGLPDAEGRDGTG